MNKDVISLDDDDDDDISCTPTTFSKPTTTSTTTPTKTTTTVNKYKKTSATTTTTTNKNKYDEIQNSLDEIENDNYEVEEVFRRDDEPTTTTSTASRKRKNTTTSTAANTKKDDIIRDFMGTEPIKLDSDNPDDDFVTTTTTSTIRNTATSAATKRSEAAKAHKQERDLLKQKKMEEKEEAKRLKEANKKKSKKEALKEISIHFDNRLPEAEISDLLKMMTTKNDDLVFDNMTRLSIPYSVLWKRNGKEEEDVIILLYPASELYSMVENNTFISKLSNLILNNTDKKFILLVEGLDYYLKTETQKMSAHINSQLKQQQSSSDSSTLFTKKFYSRQEFDKIFLELQFKHNIMIRNVNNREETSLFLSKCTECISMLPYREDNSKLFQGFCPEAIKKKYKTATDIWSAQLLMISGISRSIASSIIVRYPNIKSLYDDYYKPGMDDNQRRTLLKDLKIESSNKKLGPVLSARIFLIFCSKDPNELVK